MNISKELGPMLDAEKAYIEDIKAKLLEIGDSLTDKSERDLRMGFRNKALIDIRLARAALSC